MPATETNEGVWRAAHAEPNRTDGSGTGLIERDAGRAQSPDRRALLALLRPRPGSDHHHQEGRNPRTGGHKSSAPASSWVMRSGAIHGPKGIKALLRPRRPWHAAAVRSSVCAIPADRTLRSGQLAGPRDRTGGRGTTRVARIPRPPRRGVAAVVPSRGRVGGCRWPSGAAVPVGVGTLPLPPYPRRSRSCPRSAPRALLRL